MSCNNNRFMLVDWVSREKRGAQFYFSCRGVWVGVCQKYNSTGYDIQAEGWGLLTRGDTIQEYQRYGQRQAEHEPAGHGLKNLFQRARNQHRKRKRSVYICNARFLFLFLWNLWTCSLCIVFFIHLMHIQGCLVRLLWSLAFSLK